ncbi:Glycosyl transferase, group 1 domain protein, partial [mine drainage metagenome]
MLERLSIGLASFVIAPGERIRREVMAMGVPGWKVGSLYPIVGHDYGSSPSLPPAPTSPTSIPEHQPFRHRFVLSIGQQTGRKRFDLLIEAVRHSVKDLDLVLVGNGPLHEEYRGLVEQLGLEDRVTFVTDASDQRVQD